MRRTANTMILPEQRKQLRWFHRKYPWVLKKDLAKLFGVSRPRITYILKPKTYILKPKGDKK